MPGFYFHQKKRKLKKIHTCPGNACFFFKFYLVCCFSTQLLSKCVELMQHKDMEN